MLTSLGYYSSRFGLAGLLQHLRASLTGAPLAISVQPKGIAHPFQLRCRTSDIPTFDQVFTLGEYDFSVGRPPAVIVDAGANIGLASIYFANRYPTARIIAVEPEAGNFDLLRRNVAPYAAITPVRAALWRENTEIDLVDPGFGHWGFMTEDLRARAAASPAVSSVERQRHRVPALTVDRLMEDHGLERISILKIDIEGAEREVFEDSSAWLTRVDALIVELHDRMKPGCSRSFYNGSAGFDREWMQGENVYLSRAGLLIER